jgi:flagellar biosynthesis/type III secretory pathway M-ring protein FliF/YscJ
VYDGEEVNSEDAVANRKLDAEQQESKRREKDLQKRLDVAFGAGTTQAMVQVELNMDEVEIKEQTETPGEAPISRDSVTEQLEGSPGRNAGAAGSESNLPGQAAARPEDDKGSSYKSETSSEKFPSSHRTTSTKKAAGGVESLTVSVLVDQTKVEDLQAVEAFVNGLLATAGERNFRATVVPTNFSSEAVARQEKVAADAAAAQRMQQVMSILPIVVLIGIGLMLIKALTKAVTPPAPAPIPSLAAAGLPGGPSALGFAGASSPHHAFQALEGPQSAAVPNGDEDRNSPEQTRPLVADQEPEYDLSQLDDIDINSFRMSPGGAHDDEDPIASLQKMISKKKNLNQDLEDEDDDVPVHIRDIREKVDVPLERIRKMAKEKPEMIANLLKSWVMEEN